VSQSASERITEQVTTWRASGPGRRGEFAFKVEGREIGHLHETAPPSSRPQGALARAASQGRMEPHPVLPDRPKPWARREAVRDRARRRDHHRRHLIRALLVPSLRRLFGRWSLWFPEPLGKLLLVRQPKPAAATE
jgi:hypothetical protein